MSGPLGGELNPERAALIVRATMMIAVAHGVVVSGCLVVEAATGATGRVVETYGDDVGVEFPGGGHREIILPAGCLLLAADQDWEPEGGWG